MKTILTCLSIVFTHSALSLSGKKTQEGSSSTPIRASNIACNRCVNNELSCSDIFSSIEKDEGQFNLFVGERSFSGSDQLFPLLFLPLVAKNAAIAMLVRFK